VFTGSNDRNRTGNNGFKKKQAEIRADAGDNASSAVTKKL